MNTQDPIQMAESFIKNVNNSAGRYVRPVFSRYPFIFMLLLTFGVTAIVEGMRFFFEEIIFFKEHPSVLVLIGIIILMLTGTLYKRLEKAE